MYREILLPVDLDDQNSWIKALPVAVSCAKAFEANLHVLYVIPDFGMSMVAQFFPSDYEQKMTSQAQENLKAFIKKHVPKDITVQHIVAQGTVYEMILSLAGEVKADLIIVGAHRPELKDYLIGHNASRVVRHANQSVLVVRE
jgi:nucleotide-binding universal stress UspA family protein